MTTNRAEDLIREGFQLEESPLRFSFAASRPVEAEYTLRLDLSFGPRLQRGPCLARADDGRYLGLLPDPDRHARGQRLRPPGTIARSLPSGRALAARDEYQLRAAGRE